MSNHEHGLHENKSREEKLEGDEIVYNGCFELYLISAILPSFFKKNYFLKKA